MNLGDVILFVVVGLFGVNYVAVRVRAVYEHLALFVPMQLLNLGAAVALMTWGIPGLTGGLQIFNWVMGLLFILKIVQHNNRLVALRREASEAAHAAADEEKKARIRAALEAGRQEE